MEFNETSIDAVRPDPDINKLTAIAENTIR